MWGRLWVCCYCVCQLNFCVCVGIRTEQDVSHGRRPGKEDSWVWGTETGGCCSVLFSLEKVGGGGVFWGIFFIYIPISDGPVYKKKEKKERLFLECVVMFTECSQNQRIDNAWWPHLFYILWMSAFMVLLFCFVWIYRRWLGWWCVMTGTSFSFLWICGWCLGWLRVMAADICMLFVLRKFADGWNGMSMYDLQPASAFYFVVCGFAEDDWEDHVWCPTSICTSFCFVRVCRRWLGWPCIVSS